MIDTAEIKVKAGNGGNGLLHNKRIKYNAFAGPDGGNGGNGGNVYLLANEQIKTLSDYKRKSEYAGQNGQTGQQNFMSGKKGEDLYLNVPIGTLVYVKTNSSKKLLADLNENNEQVLVAKGGIGGLGNAHFKSSTNQTPETTTNGTLGEENELLLELKLLSDVGLVGFPSVGKSTLLNSLTNSSYKTALYHFTTLQPNLGILKFSDNRSLILSDLPGLIEGASEGKGLGEDFLRHIERCGVLLHVLDPTVGDFYVNAPNNDIDAIVAQTITNYKIIRKEMSVWSKDIEEKPEVIIINKKDVLDSYNISQKFIESLTKSFKKDTSVARTMFFVSAYSGEGLDLLVTYLNTNYDDIISYSKSKMIKDSGLKPYKLFNMSNIPNKRVLFRDI